MIDVREVCRRWEMDRRKGCVWWDDKVAGKKKWAEFTEKECKLLGDIQEKGVEVEKGQINWDELVSVDFRENNIFWKELNSVGKNNRINRNIDMVTGSD